MSAVASFTSEPTAEQLLAAVRRAWRMKNSAEQTLARLRSYRGQTPGMRADADRALRQLTEATDTLQRVLDGAA